MRVNVKLKTQDIFDINSRIEEVEEIRNWIMNLVSYNENMFSIHFHSDGQQLGVWFEEDEHAVVFMLKWG